MRNIKFRFMSFLTALFILLGTSLPTLAVNTTASVTSNKSSYSAKATKSYTVYITNTGKKYHKKGCRYLKKSSIAVKKSSILSKGYTACKICNP
ncbi:hypothetical protein [Clostridium estertheticum]|uniref:hypothetical protein n=1 Tax=Clostridium estertheticum TaxID=238834 RepID=UPI001CF4FADD|nr:hypothetical protein [Clostridium estertheticum]MCB2358761.1 hypothetical protein [Clostridium estertheticum]